MVQRSVPMPRLDVGALGNRLADESPRGREGIHPPSDCPRRPHPNGAWARTVEPWVCACGYASEAFALTGRVNQPSNKVVNKLGMA